MKPPPLSPPSAPLQRRLLGNCFWSEELGGAVEGIGEGVGIAEEMFESSSFPFHRFSKKVGDLFRDFGDALDTSILSFIKRHGTPWFGHAQDGFTDG